MFRSGTKGVLADILDKDSGLIRERRAVPLTQIRGSWKETKEKVDTHRAERAAAQKAADDARKAAKDLRGTVIAWARQAFGLTSSHISEDYNHSEDIRVRTVVFEAMCRELDKQGWKYEG